MTTGTHCVGCVQQPYGGGLVTFSGTSTSGIMLIGESPWYDEIAAGTPFAGAAGTVLDRLLQRVSLSRADVIVTNSAWCRARRLGWYDSKDTDAACAMAQCRPYLDALIDRMRPKVLVPMGNVALRRVCGVSGIESYAGYVLDTVYGIPAVPTFHPSYIMQGNAKLSPVVIYALDRAKEIATHGFTREVPTLYLDPSINVLREYVDDWLRRNQHSSVFLDLETPESSKLDEEEVDEKGTSWQIIRASFSIEDNVAVSFPWTAPYRALLSSLLSKCDETVEWATNHFDTRRLAADGLKLPDRRVSALWAWHWLQSDLRKGLEYVAPLCGAVTPWKGKNVSDPAYYSAMDSLEGRRAYMVTQAALKAHGRWESFEKHCVQADPVLQQMGHMGILIDPAERTQFMSALEDEHDAAFSELQTLVPDSIKPHKLWKRPPKDMTGVVELSPHTRDVSRVNGLTAQESFLPHAQLAKAATMLAEVLPEADAQKWLAAAGGYQYMKVLPFLPSSWEQVQKLAAHLHIKLPKKRDAESDDDVSTEDKYLAAPARKHREFYLVRSCRKSSKLVTTYQWPLNEFSRATTVIGWHPSTLRKSSRSCNLQNIPKRSHLAKKFRRMIVAAPGHLLVEADAQAIEAVLVGWFAGSPRYIKLAKAGVHGWLTAAFHSQVHSLDDPNLPALCSESKLRWPDDYEKCKRVVHLSNYKGTPIRIAEEYPEEFPTVAAARKLQSFYFETEPGRDVLKWQNAVCMQAAHDGYLDNPFKYRHYFYEVSHYDKRRDKFVPGDDAKRCIAFLPQSTASAIQSEVLLRLAAIPRMLQWLRLIIHDSFLCEPPERDAMECAHTLQREMILPIPELGGLTIGVEVSMGKNWAPYDAATNPNGMRKVL